MECDEVRKASTAFAKDDPSSLKRTEEALVKVVKTLEQLKSAEKSKASGDLKIQRQSNTLKSYSRDLTQTCYVIFSKVVSNLIVSINLPSPSASTSTNTSTSTNVANGVAQSKLRVITSACSMLGLVGHICPGKFKLVCS